LIIGTTLRSRKSFGEHTDRTHDVELTIRSTFGALRLDVVQLKDPKRWITLSLTPSATRALITELHQKLNELEVRL